MSEHLTDEMVEMAARIRHESGPGAPSWALASDRIRQDSCRRMRLALEAVAPLIAAQALRDAADELRRLDDGRTGGYYDAGRHIIRRLDARADEIEADR